MRGDRFEGAQVLVTGASRGLGREIAIAFATEGARVRITYRTRRAEAARVAETITTAGGLADVIEMDLRDADSVAAAFSAFGAERPLDVLVNNAAEVRDAPFLTLASNQWEPVIAANLTGTYLCCRQAAAGMMARRRGAIVNVVSTAAMRASPGQANYAAAKAGVLGLTRTLAVEMAPYGVRVNAVAPGLLETGMGARLDHRIADRRRAQIPAGRFGTGAEVANAVLFLASDEASYVVGECLAVDGGLSL